MTMPSTSDLTASHATPSAATLHHLTDQLTQLWHDVQEGNPVDQAVAQSCIHQALEALTLGHACIVQRPESLETTQPWPIHMAFKQAILLAFRFFPAAVQERSLWWDKIPLLDHQSDHWQRHNIRVVPGAFIRFGAYLAPSSIIMPSFINMGAWVGEKTMIDGGAHIGSCAFIGDRCHISANVTIGGVLEPLQASPVIIEDDVFIGAGCHVVEGVHIGSGSILGSGVILTASTKVIDRATGQVISGKIPPYSVLIPGTYRTGDHGLSIACTILAKKREPGISPKTALTAALRGE